MKHFKKLVGTKVYLSPINPEDAEVFTKWVNDFEISILMSSTSRIYSLDKEREFLESISKTGDTFSIIDIESDKIIGTCGLMNVNHIFKKAELGIFIGEKEFWGNGYGTEAMELLLDFAFNILNLNSIMLIVNSFNERAIKSYEKCGFKLIGKRREAVIIGQLKYDEYYMDILASEFKKSMLLEGYLR